MFCVPLIRNKFIWHARSRLLTKIVGFVERSIGFSKFLFGTGQSSDGGCGSVESHPSVNPVWMRLYKSVFVWSQRYSLDGEIQLDLVDKFPLVMTMSFAHSYVNK